ncbi:Small ubiquitin-related modifier 1 [Hibiscus syriacus]|uniref:Small ubiquitin-related modifier 1 n=1 Tax=Hibiscus syriacus TaxID=106335 RepID=A0A6A2Z033_HIBSY|nr:Small ubiquitin-related modifier 1 [Hibiscus syriacus]
MNAYCDRQSVDFNSIAFLFDGRRLRGEQTPDEVSFRFLSVRGTTTCTNVHIAEWNMFKRIMKIPFSSSLLLQLEMEDGDEIDAMLHQTGGTTAFTMLSFL